MRTILLTLIAIGVVGGLTAFTMAQARNAPNRQPAVTPAEPKPPPPPFVSVTKADGSIVKGLLTASDPAAVTLTPPAPPGQAANDPVVIKWPEITKVSNGLTRKKVLDQWKGEHKDQLCADCKGEGTVLCATCKGTAHDPAKLPKDCATCKGELLIDCKAPRCDKGQIPCPKPCLKLTDPGWITKPDGTKVRRFPQKGGNFEVTDQHVGELIVAAKDGTKSTIPCPTCGKTGKIDCPTCHGAGKIPCPTCSKNDAVPKCPDCENGRQICKTCEGAGIKK